MKVRFADEQQCVAETMAWFSKCWVMTGGSKGLNPDNNLSPDPFYPRNAELTPEVVDKVINDVESIYAHEIKTYPGYHTGAQGVDRSTQLATPRFDLLPYPQRLAIVQGVDRIFQKYRDDGTHPSEPAPAGVDYGYC